MKLTKRQLATLLEVEQYGAETFRADRDLNRLIQLGLAARGVQGVWYFYRITPAGRAHIRKACEVTGD